MYKSDLPYHHKHHHLIIIYNYHHYLCLKDCKKTWYIVRERLSCLLDIIIVIIIHNHHHHLCLKDRKKTWHIVRERLSCFPDSEQFLQTVPVCSAGSSIHLQNDIILFIKHQV